MNKSNPEPDVGDQAVQIAPEYAKGDEESLARPESAEETGGKTGEPPGDHLIQSPGAVAEKKVGYKSGYGPHGKSGYRAKNVPGADYNIGARLHTGDSSERDSQDRRNGSQHGDKGYFLGA